MIFNLECSSFRPSSRIFSKFLLHSRIWQQQVAARTAAISAAAGYQQLEYQQILFQDFSPDFIFIAALARSKKSARNVSAFLLHSRLRQQQMNHQEQQLLWHNQGISSVSDHLPWLFLQCHLQINFSRSRGISQQGISNSSSRNFLQISSPLQIRQEQQGISKKMFQQPSLPKNFSPNFQNHPILSLFCYLISQFSRQLGCLCQLEYSLHISSAGFWISRLDDSAGKLAAPLGNKVGCTTWNFSWLLQLK